MRFALPAPSTAALLLVATSQIVAAQGPGLPPLSRDSVLLAPPAAPSAAKPAPPPWVAAHADLGLVNTSGNTNVNTLNFSDGVTWFTSHRNKLSQDAGITYGTVSNRVQTSLWTGDLRDAYTLTPYVGFYGLVEYDRNTFAGIVGRFDESVGAALVPIHAGRNRLEVDIGVSAVQERATIALADLNYPGARGAVIYQYTFLKQAFFQESVEDLTDVDRASNSLVNSKTSLVAPLSKHIALKAGYEIRYAGDPPPGFKTTDRLLTTDLQLNM